MPSELVYVKPAARPPRPFFAPSAASARPRPVPIAAEPADGSVGRSTSAVDERTSVRNIRSYRRRLPSPSIAESLWHLLWPHAPTRHSPQSRSTYLSLLPPDVQQHFEDDMKQQLAAIANALLAASRELDALCCRAVRPDIAPRAAE